MEKPLLSPANAAPKKKSLKAKLRRVLLSSTEQGRATSLVWKVWLAILFVLCMILLVFALVDIIVQFRKITRTRAIALDSDYDLVSDPDENSDIEHDTQTLYSAAYIFAGPLDLPLYFFLGAMLAYFASRSYNLKLYYANVQFRDWAILAGSGAVALLVLIWRFVFELKVRSRWDEINRIERLLSSEFEVSQDLPDDETIQEYDIPYVVLWGSSPFTERSQFLFTALVFMMIFVAFKLFSLTFMWQRSTFPAGRGDSFEDAFEVSGMRLVNVNTINLLLATATLGLFMFFVIILPVPSTRYWLMFHATPLLIFGFIYAGWCSYLMIAKAWWTNAFHHTEQIERRITKDTEEVKQELKLLREEETKKIQDKIDDLCTLNISDEERNELKDELKKEMDAVPKTITEDRALEKVRSRPIIARRLALATFFVTVAVGIAAIVFGAFHIGEALFVDCSAIPLNEMSDLKQGVCNLIYNERHEVSILAQEKNTGTVHTLYNIFSIWFYASIILQFIFIFVVTISIWCRPTKFYTYKSSGVMPMDMELRRRTLFSKYAIKQQ